MTDRELLELAAKAAGIAGRIREWVNAGPDFTTLSGDPWNPLTDDGDALRLAVKMEMHVETYSFGFDSGPCVNICTWADRMKGFNRSLCERVTDEDYATATRRAIVRAAAEIGKALP